MPKTREDSFDDGMADPEDMRLKWEAEVTGRFIHALCSHYKIPRRTQSAIAQWSEENTDLQYPSFGGWDAVFPGYPVRFSLLMVREIVKQVGVVPIFRDFETTVLFRAYQRHLEECPPEADGKIIALVFFWPYFQKRGGRADGLVIHNQPISLSRPGTRLLCVGDAESDREPYVLSSFWDLIEGIDTEDPEGSWKNGEADCESAYF